MTSINELKKESKDMNKREFDKLLRLKLKEKRIICKGEIPLKELEQEAFEELVEEVAIKVAEKKTKKKAVSK